MPFTQNIHTSIVIPTHNQYEMLSRLIVGLNETAAQFSKPVELLVVDNNSNDAATLDYLNELQHADSVQHFAKVTVLVYPYPFNYSAINNFAASNSSGDFLCFLNNDVEVISTDWLAALHEPLSNENAGCAGAMLYFPDNTIQHAGVYLDPVQVAGHLYKNAPRGSHGYDNFLTSVQELDVVTAACLLVKQKVFWQVNGFDETFAVAFNDVDFCLRLKKAGFQNYWTPFAQLYHHESKSRGTTKRSFRSRLRHKNEVRTMKKRWSSELAADRLKEIHSIGASSKFTQ